MPEPPVSPWPLTTTHGKTRIHFPGRVPTLTRPPQRQLQTQDLGSWNTSLTASDGRATRGRETAHLLRLRGSRPKKYLEISRFPRSCPNLTALRKRNSRLGTRLTASKPTRQGRVAVAHAVNHRVGIVRSSPQAGAAPLVEPQLQPRPPRRHVRARQRQVSEAFPAWPGSSRRSSVTGGGRIHQAARTSCTNLTSPTSKRMNAVNVARIVALANAT